MTTRWLAFAASLALVWHVGAVAMTAADVAPLAQDDYADKEAAIQRLVDAGDAPALAVLQALDDDTVVATSSGQILLQSGDRFTDAVTGRQVPESVGSEADPVSLNNRLRGLVSGGLAAAKLASPDLAVRRAAVDALLQSPDPAFKKQIDPARDREKDTTTRERLDTLWAMASLQDPDAALRYEAVRLVAARNDLQMRELLLPLLVRNADGTYAEPDEQVRKAAQAGIDTLDSRQRWGDLAGTAFAGLSLGSVLLLAALGLAITYGLIGVINMAHGEFLMIGAYATFSVQKPVSRLPSGGLRLVPAGGRAGRVCGGGPGGLHPGTAGAAASVWPAAGNVADHLRYQPAADPGDPHAVRRAERAGDQSGVDERRVRGPAQPGAAVQPCRDPGVFLCGSGDRVVSAEPHAAGAVRAGRDAEPDHGGMRGRADPSRSTAMPLRSAQALPDWVAAHCRRSAMWGPTWARATSSIRSWWWCWAGWGNWPVPWLARWGLGILSKLIEPFWGAVLAKIAVLVLIVLFIQKRPQGMFALKGRSAEA